MIGPLLALACAATFGLNTAIVRRGMLRSSPYVLIIVSILLATPVFVIITFAAGQWGRAGELSGAAYVLLAIAGILNFIGGRYSNFRAIKAVGANLTAPVRMLTVLFGVLLGITILDEQVGPLRWAGIALLMIAPLIAFSQPAVLRRELQSGTPLRFAEGFIFGLLAAAAYGGATFLIRYVLAGTGLSLLGATIAHIGAATVLVASLGLGRNRDDLRALDRTSQKIFVLVTITMVLAQVFRFSALEAAPISVVAPLVETMAFFGLGFAYLLNRGNESFSPLVIMGTILAVAGAAAVTM